MSHPSSTLPDSALRSGRPATPFDDALPRRLGIWSAIAVLVGSTIGSGIFRVPSTVAADVGTVGAMALLWILGAVIALFGALTLAELAALFPRSGGIYVFLREAYGPLPAFLFGWTELLVIRPSALGGIAMLFAEYVQTFTPISDTGVRLVAAGAILVLATANILSVKWGALVQNVSTAAKALTLVGLAVVAFVLGNGSAGALAAPIEWAPLSWGGFGIALVAVMWAYDGWADLTFMAGEVKDPARTMPRALLGGTLAVIAIYLVVNAAYLYVLPVAEMAGRPLVAADAARTVFGQAGASIVAAMVMLSAFGALNGSTMTGPRIFYAMADDGLFFRPIAAVHPRFQTPFAAIALAAALGIGYVSIRTFEQLADAFILGIWPFYALAVGAVFLLRRRRPDLHRPYRTVGYPLVPLVFLLASVAMLLNAVFEEPGQTLFGFGVILVGIPVYWLWKGRGGARAG
ncbi:MAG TPA: amino acid permease [Longimicrobiaceae bacterium]|nr:amino acid permease [Longimicrobiaceae bacterium]